MIVFCKTALEKEVVSYAVAFFQSSTNMALGALQKKKKEKASVALVTKAGGPIIRVLGDIMQ